jgi:hypothetical protein
MTVLVIFRIIEFALGGMTIHLLIRAEQSLKSSVPVNVHTGESLAGTGRKFLIPSWVLFVTDVLEFGKSVGAMLWNGGKGGDASGADGSGGDSDFPASCSGGVSFQVM